MWQLIEHGDNDYHKLSQANFCRSEEADTLWNYKLSRQLDII